MLKRNKNSTELRIRTSILLSVESERIIKRPLEDEAENKSHDTTQQQQQQKTIFWKTFFKRRRRVK